MKCVDERMDLAYMHVCGMEIESVQCCRIHMLGGHCSEQASGQGGLGHEQAQSADHCAPQVLYFIHQNSLPLHLCPLLKTASTYGTQAVHRAGRKMSADGRLMM